MELWVGTSGYSYADWVGDFYPKGTSSAKMLPYYARHFPLVELNFTFYRPPTAQQLTRLADQVPAGFQFIVKLHQSFSHEHHLAGAAHFRNAVEILAKQHSLLALLCQFPQRFHYDTVNLGKLEALAEAFQGMDLAVEFRHASWNRPEVKKWLTARHLHLVSVDVPPIASLFPSGVMQTSRLLYVRMHSRRTQAWYAGEKERYDYLYSDSELYSWIDELAARQGRADRALLLFNNCYLGQAVRNAQRVQELIRTGNTPFTLVEPPPPPVPQQGYLFEEVS
jgi:uncharacterized protein YecE (DUF72 family)